MIRTPSPRKAEERALLQHVDEETGDLRGSEPGEEVRHAPAHRPGRALRPPRRAGPGARNADAHGGQYTGPVPAEATAPPRGRACPGCVREASMQPDLRSHLVLLERHGKLVRVPRPVDPRTELAALIIEAEHRRQAVLFESVRGSACRASPTWRAIGPCWLSPSASPRGRGDHVPRAQPATDPARRRRRGPGPGGRPHRGRGRPPAAAAHRPRRQGCRSLLHRRAGDRARSGDGPPQRLIQPDDAPGSSRGRDPDDAAAAPGADLRASRRPRPRPAGRGRHRQPSRRARRRRHHGRPR